LRLHVNLHLVMLGHVWISSWLREVCENNIAFTCQLALGNVGACVDILMATGRIAEAVLFSRTYQPSLTPGLVEKWKLDLVKTGKETIANSIASPDGNLDLFPGWVQALDGGKPNSDIVEIGHKVEGMGLESADSEPAALDD